MTITADDLEHIHRRGADGVHWHASMRVDKYSPDQVAYAARRFREEQAWRGVGVRAGVDHALKRFRYGAIKMDGSDFMRYFPGGPEMGSVSREGNILVATGLTNLISLWMGLTGTAINPLRDGASGTSVVGVGTGTSAAATADTTLISNGGSAWFQGFDAASFGTTTTNGVMVGTCTVASGNGNFAWNEWCWATGSGAVTSGANGGTTAGSPFATGATWQMVNHKTNVNLGSKASGSSWVFSTQIQIS